MTVGEKSVNPLPDGTSRTKREPEKKDPLRGSFFSYRPSAGAAPRSVPTQQTVYVVAPTSQLLTINLFFQGEAWPACRAILSFHSNTT